MNKLILLDASSVFYQIRFAMDKVTSSELTALEVAKHLLFFANNYGGFVQRSKTDMIKVIWCLDSKVDGKYWRHTLLESDGISYKSGRTPDPAVRIIRDLFTEVSIEDGWLVSSQPGFEADDMVADMCRWFPETHKEIHTCDTDMMQLIDDYAVWINTMRFEPVIRDVNSGLAYLKKKFPRYPWAHCYDIVTHKTLYGDRSDSLPPGTRRDVIDLLQPHTLPTYDQDAVDYIGSLPFTSAAKHPLPFDFPQVNFMSALCVELPNSTFSR